MRQHHWSGWPGAYCLDCGADDENEWALANDPEFDVFSDPPPADRNKPCTSKVYNPNCGQCWSDRHMFDELWPGLV